MGQAEELEEDEEEEALFPTWPLHLPERPVFLKLPESSRRREDARAFIQSHPRWKMQGMLSRARCQDWLILTPCTDSNFCRAQGPGWSKSGWGIQVGTQCRSQGLRNAGPAGLE